MTITVDYTASPWLITFAQADLTLVSGTEYSITVDKMWELLRDYADSEEGIARPNIYRRIPSTSSTPAITEVNDNYYAAQFEDGLYSVEIINGNSNFRDVEVKNQVSVGTNNTTGFIDPTFLQFSTYEGGVWLDVVNGVSGTSYPTGTPAQPVNNLMDAEVIANTLGLETIFIKGSYTFQASDVVDGYVFNGISSSKSFLILTEAASITNCIFRDLTLQGYLDGGNDASFCVINGLDYIDGSLLDCFLTNQPLVLNGAQANLLRCASAVPGGGAGQTVNIDMGGTGTDLVIRDFQGGMNLYNHTSGTDNVSIDMSSGRVVIDPTISSGEYTIRGIAAVEDNSTGTAVVNVQVLDPQNLNRAAFTDGGVYLDAASSNTGTAFPTGTPIKAVNNMVDAITIARNEGLTKIFVTGFFALAGTEVLDGITLIGGSGASNVVGLTAGVSTVNSGFERLIIYGRQGGLSRIVNCVIGITGLGSLTEVEGRIVDCIINSASGITQKTTGAGTLFDNCSFIYTNNPQITFNANGKAYSFRDCTGNILVTNSTDTEIKQIHLSGGEIEFATSCTAGEVVLSGTAEYTDNSVGMTVIATQLLSPEHVQNIHGQVERAVWIDTEKVVNGNGYQETPYNNFTDAVDYAEANNLYDLVIHADAVVDRQLKNFVIIGQGRPTIDLNNQIFDKSTFERCTLTGSHQGDIQATECAVVNLSGARGVFLTCSFAGTIIPASGSDLLISRVAPAQAATPWVLDMNTGTASTVAIHNSSGGIIIRNMDDAGDVVHLLSSQGDVTIENTCTAGNIVISGDINVTNNSAGTTVSISNTSSEILLDAIA